MRIVVLGLSLSSSWGNGHATTYRALLAALAARGHEILFLECDKPWYAAHRDLAEPAFCDLRLYDEADGVAAWQREIEAADLVVLGSYVPNGIAVGHFVQRVARGITAFYDIDTPVTLAKLESGDIDYLSPELIRGFDVYLSFTGGPTLRHLETRWHARHARAFYCSVDPALYRPLDVLRRWDLGYLGTYSADRQPTLERLLIEPARRLPGHRFVVAGPQYPSDIAWPENVERIEHLGPADHAEFYSSLGWTLNVTRADMRAAGYSPSVRLFEAAACGTPIMSDSWPGLGGILAIDREVAVADEADEVLALLGRSEERRMAMATAARARVLAAHTADHRAAQLEGLAADIRSVASRRVAAA